MALWFTPEPPSGDDDDGGGSASDSGDGESSGDCAPAGAGGEAPAVLTKPRTMSEDPADDAAGDAGASPHGTGAQRQGASVP